MDSTKSHTNIDDLITAYLAQGLESDQLTELQNWIEAAPENKKHFQQMYEIWFSSVCANNQKKYNQKEAYQRFLTHNGSITKKTFSLRPLLYRAAAIALLCIISFVSYHTGSEQVKKQFAEMVIEAPLGSKTKLHLPDGTLVWLNAGSKITYSQGFGVNDRTLKFQGEAYFEVEKNKELPFNIRTQELNVTVLGTKFNFRNYPEDKEAVVDLIGGRVALENNLKEMALQCLSPTEKMVLDKITGNIKISNTDTKKARDWTENILMFDEDLLPDIARELERSYNVKIHIANDSLKDARFYGYFNQRNQNIDEVLEILSSTGRLRYKIGKDSTITLQ